jgi:hypothetical protein
MAISLSRGPWLAYRAAQERVYALACSRLRRHPEVTLHHLPRFFFPPPDLPHPYTLCSIPRSWCTCMQPACSKLSPTVTWDLRVLQSPYCVIVPNIAALNRALSHTCFICSRASSSTHKSGKYSFRPVCSRVAPSRSAKHMPCVSQQ